MARMLAQHRIATVLDVGANEGQYARLLRQVGFRGRIVSFEPLSSAHGRLSLLARKDPMWIVAPRMAIGDRDGEIRVNVASKSVASSVLPMMGALERADRGLAYIGAEVVPVYQLDRAAAAYLSGTNDVFLKVDVQGYEREVLQGASNLLRRIGGVQLELSFVPLYQGQALFREMLEGMRALGFAVWGILPGLADDESGRLLQTDVIFFREPPSSQLNSENRRLHGPVEQANAGA